MVWIAFTVLLKVEKSQKMRIKTREIKRNIEYLALSMQQIRVPYLQKFKNFRKLTAHVLN